MIEALVFYVFAGLLAFSGVAVLAARNIVHSAMWLLGALCSTAALYLLLSATFLAAVQLVVYAGGILILIVFGIMLTARSPQRLVAPPAREIVAAIGVSFVLLCSLLALMFAGQWPEIAGAAPTSAIPEMKSIGQALLTSYLVPFELVSLLLLAVLIGAALLARPERR